MDNNAILSITRDFDACNSKFLPEPYGESFYKFNFMHLMECGDAESERKALVDICNCHGIQLPNDVRFRRELPLQAEIGGTPPVLKSQHMQMFESYNELISKLRELPEEWTVVQITKEFDALDVLAPLNCEMNVEPRIAITRLPCGARLDVVNPYVVRIFPSERSGRVLVNPVHKLEELLKLRREYYNNNRNRELRKVVEDTDINLIGLLVEIEKYWLQEWKCLLNGNLRNSSLEKVLHNKISSLTDNIKILKENSPNRMKSHNLLFQLILSAHLLSESELSSGVNLALKCCYERLDKVTLKKALDGVKKIRSEMKELETAEKLPVILIVDNSFEQVPWEMTKACVGHPVCRIQSLHLLYAMFKFHQPSIVNGYSLLPIDTAYCLLNPSKDLNDCEKIMSEVINRDFPWIDLHCGEPPAPDLLPTKLMNTNVYLYCGHGSGTQYFKAGALKKVATNGLIMLYGCCSGLPHGRGGRTPYQDDTYTYLLNGATCLIGALYDLSSTDADVITVETISNILPIISQHKGMRQINNPVQPDVVKALVASKSFCRKYLTKCSFIARGIPVKVVVGEEEKRQIKLRLS